MAAETCSDISSAGSCPSLRVCRPVMRQKRSPDVPAGAKEREEKKKGIQLLLWGFGRNLTGSLRSEGFRLPVALI